LAYRKGVRTLSGRKRRARGFWIKVQEYRYALQDIVSNTAPVIAGLAIGVMLIIVIASLPNSHNNDFDLRFTRYDSGQTIYLEMSSVENDESALQTLTAITNAFVLCEYKLVHISYGLGSMTAAIEGVQGDLCSMAVAYEIEQGGEKLDCHVPQGRLANWMTWMNRGMPTVDEIKPYCNKVGDIRPIR
jgi:hypothetical protein